MIDKLPLFFKEPHTIAESDNKSYLIALSGGADSSALLHILCKYRDLYGVKLYAAHINHNIRTDGYENEALRDENFCRRLCEENNIELFVASIDVPQRALKNGNSLETEAREARYEFFAEVMNANNIKILLTAHNADDNLETQIFNLCRGCGTDGICGILPLRKFDKVENGFVVRPILSASKKEILAFCKEYSLQYVTDSTNLEENCTRNIIRHRIIPQLKDLFNAPERSALRLSRLAEEDKEYLAAEADRFLKAHNGIIYRKDIISLHPAISKRVLKSAFESCSSEKLEAIHIQEILDFAACNKNGYISLPGRMRASYQGNVISFEKDVKSRCATDGFDHKLKPGINILEPQGFLVNITTSAQAPESISTGEKTYTYLTSALVKNISIDTMTASNRAQGDKIFHGGMNKKIKKLMCDKKIDQAIRDLLPIIRLGESIVYVPLCAVSDRYTASPNDFKYNITIYRAKTEA